MNPASRFGAGGKNSGLEVLWEDGERLFCRTSREGVDGTQRAVLAVLPAAERPTRDSLDRLAHEYGLKDHLDGAWALRPLELVRDGGETMLLLESPGGEPLARLMGPAMELGRFLRLAAALAAALGRLHERGLVHKDIKPTNVIVDSATGHVRLTGFGIASLLPRERRAPVPPEFIEGTLAYMAPEQTGRMNRSIDSRSDLYSLGITLYQMLTGSLPFTASYPMEWVHCHIARQPTPPNERFENVPASVSAIIMKLLAKTAEERYQTAAGVESDLRRCLADWETRCRIDEFPLGGQDAPDRLLIPEKLYGRAHEIDTLLAAFDRVAASGTPELVLVCGYSGVGKSSIVHELHKALVPGGLFASGKFDQYKRDIPYATLAQAFQSLVRPLLGKSDAELGGWRDALRQALGANGPLMADLVPELKLIIGEQAPVPDLPPQDAQRRFQLVLRRFMAVFARPEHPLVLFLDDLQWLDAATLEFLENLLTEAEVRHLMLIGAYRDNEVSSAHPLMRKLEAIRKAGATVREIVLAPLSGEDLGRLIGDSLHGQSERTASLAQLVHEKTAGNPFFAIQFISTLAEEGLLIFDRSQAHWYWDLDRIYAKGHTDNVVDLMVGKLNRLSARSQKALQLFACVGHSAEYAALATAYEGSDEDLRNGLWEAVQAGLVFRAEGNYQFLHDRVREAAYSLIPAQARAPTHLRIGRLLASRTETAELEERIFEIVNQLNRAPHLIISSEERERVAELNFIAGRRARISTAYAAALEYFAAGRAMLTEEDWKHNHPLMFGIELQMAQCELLTADMAAAEQRLAILTERARGIVDSAAITCVRINLYATLDQNHRAVEAGMEYLSLIDGQWSLHVTAEDVRREYARLWELLGAQSTEALREAPLMSDPDRRATMDVLSAMATSAHFADENLFRILICRTVAWSLEHGNSEGSCLAYVRLGGVLGAYFGQYQAGYRFGTLGVDLVERLGLDHLKARVYFVFGAHVAHWTRHLTTCQAFLRRAFDTAQESGDHAYAAYSSAALVRNCLACGDQLGEAEREADTGLEFLRQRGLGTIRDRITVHLRLIRMLRGLTSRFGSFDGAEFDERRFEQQLEHNSRLADLACVYWIRKLQAGVYVADYATAVAAAAKVEPLLWTAPTQFDLAEYHFFAALGRAACCDARSAENLPQHFGVLSAHHRQILVWAENSPENFASRAALVGGEIARIEARDLDAMDLYEQAIRSAHANGFVHVAALANEFAARFYAARGFEKIAQTYRRDARHCYLRWGADGKVRQLDELYPHLRDETPPIDPTGTILAPVEHLDLATVLKVSQAVSSEIVVERLIDTLMRTALEHAGAERGLLILVRGDEYRMEAEATTGRAQVTISLRQASVTAADLPLSVLHYVGRTKQSAILHDAADDSPFAGDEYIHHHRARSLLCLPLLKPAKLVGMLYLENNLTRGAFTPARLAVLKLLASQAAISLENTRLYGDLQEREAKVRRLVDAALDAVLSIDEHGRITEWNAQAETLFGWQRTEALGQRLSETLIPTQYRTDHQEGLQRFLATGAGPILNRRVEFTALRRDGSDFPVEVAVAPYRIGGSWEFSAFIRDITERKRAEASLLRYREVEMELAHANRVATMGQLSASIAHEVNQPITATVTNAQAALRWLDAESPDVEEIRQALGRIVRNGNRASEVVGRIRALVKKSPPHLDNLEINEAIREVIALTHGEAVKNGVSVQTQLAKDLSLVRGDRVQLQQVVLNLMINAVEAMSGVHASSRDLVISTAKATSDELLVAVRDSGPGLDAASLERVFEPFYTTKPNGLGIGLSICRSIIEAHGGRLWASPSLPQGALFQFTLPAHTCGAP